ncbi:MAG: hypothetical protein ACOX4W_01740 [Bacilli bacterium]|jgi:hypothetical protein
MNEKTFKKWLIGISIFAGIAVLYFLIYFIAWVSTPHTMDYVMGGALVAIQPYAIAWLGVAIVSYGILILVSYRLEKKQAVKEMKKEQDQELLKQYTSKKK